LEDMALVMVAFESKVIGSGPRLQQIRGRGKDNKADRDAMTKDVVEKWGSYFAGYY